MMGALELYQLNANKARYQVQHETWFHRAQVAVVRGRLLEEERFKDAPKHVLDHYAYQYVHDPRNTAEKAIRRDSERVVHDVLLVLRKAGIVPVPLDS